MQVVNPYRRTIPLALTHYRIHPKVNLPTHTNLLADLNLHRSPTEQVYPVEAFIAIITKLKATEFSEELVALKVLGLRALD